MRSILLVFLVLAFSGALFAQEAPAPESPEYQVTVTADRLEESVAEKTDSITVITREDIEAHQWNYVIDALRQTPGLTVLQSGSAGKVTSTFLRGAAGSQVLVLLDGIPINNPYFGGVNLEDLTTNNVDRIEVLRGPQSPLYGSDAMGGVIQIFTRRGNGPAAAQVSFEGGSFQTYREDLGLHGAAGRLNYSAEYSRQDSGGITDNDEYRQNVFSASAGYRLNDSTELRGIGRAYDSHVGIPYDAFLQPAPNQNQDGTLWLTGGGVRSHSGNLLNLDAMLSYNDRSYRIEDPDSLFVPLTKSDSGVTQLNIQNDFHLPAGNTLSAGYEFEHQAIQGADITGTFLDETINNHALFVQDKFEAGRWILAAGLRYDHYNTFGDTVNPRVSGAFKVTESAKIRGSYGTAFRAPAAGDLYYPYYGNPDLKPEKSKAWEAGFDQYWSHAAISVSWFHNTYEDLITFDPVTFLAGNVASARTQGLELSGSWTLNAWKFTGTYTYLDAIDDVADKRLYRRPKNTATFRAAYETTRWGAAVSLLAMGNRLEPDYSTFPATDVLNPSFATLDLAGYFKIANPLKLTGRIQNLTDRSYQQILGYPSPGIGFYGGIATSF